MSPCWVPGCQRKRMSGCPPGQRMPWGGDSPGLPSPLCSCTCPQPCPTFALPPSLGFVCFESYHESKISIQISLFPLPASPNLVLWLMA